MEYGDAAMSVGVSELDRPIGIFAMLRMALEKVPQVWILRLEGTIGACSGKRWPCGSAGGTHAPPYSTG